MSTVDSLGIAHAESTDSTATSFSRRAPRISQADVFRAADELLVQGDRPTIDRVRMRLGRGSPNTINDHLDAWWANLGARLRDLPGQEFPHLPKRVAHTLQQLWNEALTAAHETLQSTLIEREGALLEREAVVAACKNELAEREQAAAARTAALEDSLALAREQLAAANQRAQALEISVQERDAECARLRARNETVEAACADWRNKLDAAYAAHQAERVQLQEGYAAAESHWLLEVDRARQSTKEAGKDHERQLKELRNEISSLNGERDRLRQDAVDARTELKATAAIRAQLEEHWRRLKTGSGQQTEGSKSRRPPKSKRTTG